MSKTETIGIIGAGKLGVVLSQLALKAGYNVYVSGSGDPKDIELTMQVLAPGAIAATSEEVARRADIIILALPLGKYRQLPRAAFAGKLVIDAANYWWETDGPRDEFMDPSQSSSEAMQEFLSQSRVIKALNHIGYHDLYDETKPAGKPGRKAIAVAGDGKKDIEVVSDIINKLGFDPVYIGDLSKGRKLEPGGKVFGVNVDSKSLTRLLQG